MRVLAWTSGRRLLGRRLLCVIGLVGSAMFCLGYVTVCTWYPHAGVPGSSVRERFALQGAWHSLGFFSCEFSLQWSTGE